MPQIDSHSVRSLASLALVVSLVGCLDTSIDPPPPPTKSNITVKFCSGATPPWFAVKNEQEDWKAVAPGTSGSVTFAATPKVSIAFVIPGSVITTTYIVNATSSDIDGRTPWVCTPATGTKELNGAVSGISGEQIVRMTAASAVASASVSAPNFALTNLPDGTIDIVATRYASAFTEPADRVLIRRGLIPLSGNIPISTLDFATQSQPLTPSTLTLNGAVASDFLDVTSEFISANGTAHLLGQLNSLDDNNMVGFVSVPGGIQSAGDIHVLTATTSSISGIRTLEYGYKNGGDRSLTLGPLVNPAVISSVAQSPYLRVRASMESQSSYPSAVRVEVRQLIQGAYRSVSMLTTSGFLGVTPTAWELTVPDFSQTGYQTTWALQPNVAWQWIAFAWNGAPARLFGDRLTDGQLVTSSIRSGP